MPQSPQDKEEAIIVHISWKATLPVAPPLLLLPIGTASCTLWSLHRRPIGPSAAQNPQGSPLPSKQFPDSPPGRSRHHVMELLFQLVSAYITTALLASPQLMIYSYRMTFALAVPLSWNALEPPCHGEENCQHKVSASKMSPSHSPPPGHFVNFVSCPLRLFVHGFVVSRPLDSRDPTTEQLPWPSVWNLEIPTFWDPPSQSRTSRVSRSLGPCSKA